MIKNILKTRLSFKKPKSSKLLIFDKHKTDFVLSKFGKINYSVLQIRYEELNIYVLYKMIFNFKFNLTFMQNYILVYISVVRPKLIITFIDNNVFFYKLKNYFPRTKTLVIQNGLSAQFFFKRIKNEKKLRVDFVLCWGKVVSRKFKSFFNSKNYEIGSIRSNEVRLERYKKNEKKFYLISGFGSISRLDYNNEIIQKKIKLMSKVLNSVYEMCKNNGLKFYILKKTNLLEETKYYKNILKDKQFYFEKKTDSFSNYKVIDKNKYFLSFDSAMGLEAISRGAKVMILNFQKCFNLPYNFNVLWGTKLNKNGPFWSSTYSQKNIEKNFKFLISSNNYTWKKKSKNFKQLLNIYDYQNTKFKKILKKILKKN